jgi:hypothetical protein
MNELFFFFRDEIRGRLKDELCESRFRSMIVESHIGKCIDDRLLSELRIGEEMIEVSFDFDIDLMS